MERMRNKDLENAWAVQWIRQEKCAKLEEENKKLKEKLQWWKDLVQKAKEFEYDEDGMDYIRQNTKI
jgi:hypothetical protein